jgi:hypothetical protein
MRRTRSGCCAPAASGDIVAAALNPLMKSRRRIASPQGHNYADDSVQ